MSATHNVGTRQTAFSKNFERKCQSPAPVQQTIGEHMLLIQQMVSTLQSERDAQPIQLRRRTCRDTEVSPRQPSPVFGKQARVISRRQVSLPYLEGSVQQVTTPRRAALAQITDFFTKCSCGDNSNVDHQRRGRIRSGCSLGGRGA